MPDNKNLLHYLKFIGLALIIAMIWLRATRSPKLPAYDSGQPKSSGTIVNGKAEGTWTWWYQNGKKMTEGNFVAGKRTGTWATWYEDGAKKSMGIYRNDKLNGHYFQWHKNGKLKQSGNFVNDKQEGIHSYYGSTGMLTEERLYQSGGLIKTNKFNINETKQ